MSGPSNATRALFEAAKADAPSSAARASMWAGVATKTGAAGAGAGVGALTLAKVLAAGAVVGAVGVGTVVTVLPSSRAASSDRATTHAAAVVTRGGSRTIVARAVAVDDNVAPSVALVAPDAVTPVTNDIELGDDSVAPPSSHVAHVSTARDTQAESPITSDALTREARMVAEARGALVRGHADEALATIQDTRALPRRALEPEELSIEARSLRALGRIAEAASVESDLRARFPDHALAR